MQIADATAFTLANRLKLGRTLVALEAVIPPAVLHRTVSEAQLVDVDSGGLVPKIAAYWTTFTPSVEETYDPGPGAKAPEFELVLDLMKRTGHTPFLPLLGRIRNLHRLTEAALFRLKTNFTDHSRARRVDVVLLTGHDPSGSFRSDRPLLEDLIVNSPNLVLVLEGQASLAAVTAEIPALAASYGKPDSTGTPRLGQVMISGHGSARSVGLAGTGPPDAAGAYPTESIDLDHNLAQSKALIDALLTNMDPATAKLVFNGCLVGANPVTAGTPDAAIAGQIGTTPSLATYVQQRATALGLPPGFSTLAARASVSAPSSFRNGTGDLTFTYPRDPDAFGPAAGYVATGIEPEGLFTAAVEVAALSSAATAETLLRNRLARPADPGDWWDTCTRALVTVALRPIGVGAGISAERLNGFAHLAGTPFLSHFGGDFGVGAGTWVSEVNPHPDAADIYTTIVATSFMAAPTDQKAIIGRFTLEQGWLAMGGARIAPMITFLDGTPATFTGRSIQAHLDTVELAGQSAVLFPVGGPTSSGRLRLALAWLFADPANADVQAYLNAQVNTPASGPELNAALTAELGGIVDTEVLGKLGRLVAVVPPAAPGAAPLPAANAEIDASGTNKVRIEPQPYQATVQVGSLNVRDKPGMHGTVIAVVHLGTSLTWPASPTTGPRSTATAGSDSSIAPWSRHRDRAPPARRLAPAGRTVRRAVGRCRRPRRGRRARSAQRLERRRAGADHDHRYAGAESATLHRQPRGPPGAAELGDDRRRSRGRHRPIPGPTGRSGDPGAGPARTRARRWFPPADRSRLVGRRIDGAPLLPDLRPFAVALGLGDAVPVDR